MSQEIQKSSEFIAWERVQEIMGEDSIGAAEVFDEIRRRHNTPFFETDSQKFSEPVFALSESELWDYKRRNFAVIRGFPLSVVDFYSMLLYDLDFFLEDCWDTKAPFIAEEKVGNCFYLFRKSVIPDSVNRGYEEWEKMLLPNEKIPRVCEIFYFIFFYSIFTGTRLFGTYCAIAQDIVEEKFHPHVGIFSGRKELGIHYYRDENSVTKVGLAPVRRLVVL